MDCPSQPRLFHHTDLVDSEELIQEQLRLVGGDPRPRRDLDSATMWVSKNDGLLVRGVHPHSTLKAEKVSRGLDTVSTAMGPKFFDVHYGELYCGPGVLLDETTGQEIAGSPLQALGVRRRFDRYVFSDFSRDCIEALGQRVAHRPDVVVRQGDANARQDLDAFCACFDPKALVLVYLDPARPRDLHWATVEYLAGRFQRIDQIINLPVNSIARGITGASGRGFEANAAGRMINHTRPSDLICRDRHGDLAWGLTLQAIRDHYDRQLTQLGFLPPARVPVTYPGNNPYYDVLYASRHPIGMQLWNRTNPKPEDPQLALPVAA